MSELKHYGVARRSGRYPWGSGDDPEQRNRSFRGHVNELRKKGMSDAEIAKGLGISTGQLRAKITIAKAEERKAEYAQARQLKDRGHSATEIGRIMGKPESSVRALLDEATQARSEVTASTASMIRDSIDRKKYVDVGIGTERHIGVSRTKLDAAVNLLQEEGYKLHYLQVEQAGTGKKTSLKVMTKGDVEFPEVSKNRDKIKLITDYTEDGGRTYLGLEPPRSVSSSRVQIRYTEDGGSDKDGVIELRRGVPDLKMEKRYAQVRIAVDDTHFLKGMALYSDDMPAGVDIIYNTNKSKSVPKEKVFKTMEADPDNPFGSSVRQQHYIDPKTGKKELSALNIVGYKDGSGEEGAWGEWSKTLSSQMLSKQDTSLARRQLGLAYDIRKEEYDEICKLTNPAVKKMLLKSFSDDCDSAAVHLKAAALPRQQTHVILPLTKIKETEVYAPNYRDGEKVVLIRHPHGGRFEIPELVVNNRNAEGKAVLGKAKDAVGIHPKVAERLSGADFDGDTVLVIPNSKSVGIKTAPALAGLKNFDPKADYKLPDSAPRMSSRTKGIQMGNVSNLITDMTIKGATPSELARAVRHSMVVIDAEKHHLDYKQSFKDHNIGELKKKYQGSERSGASTLVSKSSSEIRVAARKDRYEIDPVTGKKVWVATGETYTNKKGKLIKKTTKSTKMYEVEDAFDLSSGTQMESAYANHANKLKALGNQARKEYLATRSTTYSPVAAKTYSKEVESLNARLNIALRNAPLERQAQLLANAVIRAKKEANPGMDADDLKKLKSQAINEARTRVGAKKESIIVTDKEWEAIQAGAVSNNTLTKILSNADPDRIKTLATPRTKTELSSAKMNRAKVLLDAGYSRADVADVLGISTTTLNKIVG